MDPVSVVGLIGSIISIADIVGKSIRKLSDLRTKDRNAPMQVTTLIGQLYIIKAVIDELTRWKSSNPTDSDRHHQLVLQMEESLECFCPMILSLEQYLNNLEVFSMANAERPDLQNRLSYLWNESDIATYMSLVDRQVNALNLLLQAVQCSNWSEQQRKMEEKENKDVLRLAKDCTSSIIGVNDRLSFITENTNTLSVQFDFDSIVLGSQVYRTAHQSHMKQIIRADRLAYAATKNHGVDEANAQEAEKSSRAGYLRSQKDNPRIKADTESYYGTTDLEGALNGLKTSSIHETDNGGMRKGESGATGTLPMEQWRPSTPIPSAPQSLRNSDDQQDEADTHINQSSRKLVHSTILGRTAAATPAAAEDAHSEDQASSPASGVTRPHLESQNSSSASTDSRERLRNRLRITSLATLRDSLRRRRQPAAQAGAMDPAEMMEADGQKVLLLGTSESGKSTVLKNLILTLEGPYTEDAKKSFHEIIFSNIVQSTRVVLEAMDPRDLPLADERMEYHVQTIFMQSACFEGETLPEEVAEAISWLWRDKGFRDCYLRRHEYQLNVNSETFAHSIDRFGSDEYVASDQDILLSRERTTGIVEKTFEIAHGTRKLLVYDVGGVRYERQSWIRVFERVSTVLFTVDATAYCKRLLEDETANRMEEALAVFGSIINSPWFTKTNFLLIFTHLDQLDEVLQLRPACYYCSDFPNPQSAGHAEVYLTYLERRFRDLVRDEEKRKALQIMGADLITGDNELLKDKIFEVIDMISH